MKAVGINRHGGPEVLEQIDIPEPTIGDYDLLVKVNYSSVNPVDCLVRRGGSINREFPIVMGYDVSGIVEDMGSKVSGFRKGDRITSSPHLFKQGANAEYVTVDYRTACIVPESVPMEDAGVIPLAGLTAYESLYERANIKEKDLILIHAGAGGVGHLAIQLSKATGCKVITTASRNESIKLCKDLGADEIINYKVTDFAKRVNEITGGKGCNAIFDFVGENVLNKSLECAAVNCQVVTITPSRITAPGINMLFKNITVHYEFMGIPTVFGVDIDSQGQKLSKLLAMLKEGLLKPVISRSIPMDKLSEAHSIIESGHSSGKVLISVE